jgi:hypothetical protein
MQRKSLHPFLFVPNILMPLLLPILPHHLGVTTGSNDLADWLLALA